MVLCQSDLFVALPRRQDAVVGKDADECRWGRRVQDTPSAKYESIKGYVSFYSGPWECFVDGEKVEAQVRR